MKKFRLICATDRGVLSYYIVAMTKRDAAQKLRQMLSQGRDNHFQILAIQ